jgi:hypothetical protein
MTIAPTDMAPQKSAGKKIAMAAATGRASKTMAPAGCQTVFDRFI